MNRTRTALVLGWVAVVLIAIGLLEMITGQDFLASAAVWCVAGLLCIAAAFAVARTP